MNVDELNRLIDTENLDGHYLMINDSRKSKLLEETRPPFSITMNIVDDDNYQVFFYDDRGYKIVSQKDLSENVACETVLFALRRLTKMNNQRKNQNTNQSNIK